MYPNVVDVCVLYVSFGSKVRPRTFGCVAMGSALLCIFRSRWFVYSAGSQTTSRDAKPTQHIEITHPNNVNLKLAFHKMASFHPHYSTFTPQTYHHPVHRFRSWPMQMTSQSHPHTQVRVQPRNTYNHTYTKFLPGQNKTTSY